MAHDDIVKFRLYVAGEAPNSQQALANLTAFCRAHLPQRHVIEVIDVFKAPELALSERILLTPALVIAEPAPRRTIIGDLNQPRVLLGMLGLESDDL